MGHAWVTKQDVKPQGDMLVEIEMQGLSVTLAELEGRQEKIHDMHGDVYTLLSTSSCLLCTFTSRPLSSARTALEPYREVLEHVTSLAYCDAGTMCTLDSLLCCPPDACQTGNASMQVYSMPLRAKCRGIWTKIFQDSPAVRLHPVNSELKDPVKTSGIRVL